MTQRWQAFVRNLARLSWSSILAVVVVAGFILGACTTQESVPTPIPVETATPTPVETATPTSAPPPTSPGEVSYQPVDVPEAQLRFEIPASWQRLEPDWAWAPAEDGWPRMGVAWRNLQPPEEAEAALLPGPAQVLNSEPVDLAWGSGRRVTLEVYGPQAGAGGTKAPVESVETHVLIVLQEGGSRRAYDLYAAGRSAQELQAIEPMLQHLLDSASLEQEAAETVAVTIYFGNSEMNPNIQDCRLVYPVVRFVTVADDSDSAPDIALAEAALAELFAGPTPAEAEQGYVSMFSAQTASVLRGVHVEGQTAYVNLADIRQSLSSAGTSCGSQAFLAEVGQTVQAVLPVERVLYAIEGDPAAFYDFMQFGCDAANDFCDPAPFEQDGS
jgi:hypothetical protein